MPEIHGEFELSIHNALTDMMKIACTTGVPARIQELFNKAIEIISPHVRPEIVTIIFTRGKLSVTFTSNHVGIYVKNLIVFDLNKLERCADDMIVAAFLEEFAHSLLDIRDEREVGYKVSEIYPRVVFNGQKYRSRQLDTS
jgi:F420-dependent methylenetetrahydromethanopterin dehydrogenase